MRGLFSLSSKQTATKATIAKSPKRKTAVLRDYPTNSPYNSTRNKKKEDSKDNDDTLNATPSKNNQQEQMTPVAASKSETQKDQSPDEEIEQKSGQLSPNSDKKQKKVTRETLVEQYKDLVQKYSAALELKSELTDEKAFTLETIEMLYSNQIKLEKGVIPESMQEELNQKQEDEAQ